MIADLTPTWKGQFPPEEMPKRYISENTARDFLLEAGINFKQIGSIERSLNPELFRVLKDGLIVTPVYMVTRACRGGSSFDSIDARDIARGLPPYSFAFGMTLGYVDQPTIHEIDLIVVAKQANKDSVWKVQEEDRPASYTYITASLDRRAYVGSFAIDKDNMIEFYKKLSRIHYIERWCKQTIFDNLDTLKIAKSAEANRALMNIRNVVNILKDLAKNYSGRNKFYTEYIFNGLSEDFFDENLSLTKLSQAKKLHERLIATDAIQLLFFEQQNMKNTYEDYRLTIYPPSLTKGFIVTLSERLIKHKTTAVSL
jgi:hypothetical protein